MQRGMTVIQNHWTENHCRHQSWFKLSEHYSQQKSETKQKMFRSHSSPHMQGKTVSTLYKMPLVAISSTLVTNAGDLMVSVVTLMSPLVRLKRSRSPWLERILYTASLRNPQLATTRSTTWFRITCVTERIDHYQ